MNVKNIYLTSVGHSNQIYLIIKVKIDDPTLPEDLNQMFIKSNLTKNIPDVLVKK